MKLDNRPLRLLSDDGSLQVVSSKEWKHSLNRDHYRTYKVSFARRTTDELEEYLAIMKSDYEVWNTWDNGYAQAISAVGIVLLTVLVTRLSEVAWQFDKSGYVTILSGGTSGLLAMIALGYFLLPIRRAAIKKAKGTFIINIVEAILRDRRKSVSQNT